MYSSKITGDTLDNGVTVESGNSVRVFTIVMDNGSGSAVQVTFQNGAGTATIFTASVPANDSKVINFEESALFDAGVRNASGGSSDVRVTYFHSATT